MNAIYSFTVSEIITWWDIKAFQIYFLVILIAGQPIQISFDIVSTQRSPVDMYFLYDISRSMYGDLDMLKKRAIILGYTYKRARLLSKFEATIFILLVFSN